MRTQMAVRLALLTLLLLGAASAAGVGSPLAAPVSAADVLLAGPPRGVHLSLTEDGESTMTVTWFTDGAADPAPVVEFGETAELGQAASATSQDVPGVVARVHEATVRGLSPGVSYHYRVAGTSGYSETFTFRTDDGDGHFRAVLFGDHGVKPTSNATVHAAIALEPDLVIIAGDLSYADGDPHVWDVWFDMMQPLAARVPLMTAIGNHETGQEGVWGNRPYLARLALPGGELFYGFDYGRVRFTMHDSDTTALAAAGLLAEAQEWFARDLADAAQRRDAGELDRIVVVQHHPLYSNHETLSRQYGAALITTQEPLMHAAGVDLLVAAHNHNYERSKPMMFGVPTADAQHDYADPLGFLFVITGGGGQSLYDFRDPNDFQLWSAAYAQRYHVVVLDVDGPRIDGSAVDTWYAPGQTFDRWSLGAGG